MFEGLHVEPLIAALGGSGLTLLLARYVLSRALAELQRLADKVSELSLALAGVVVRLEKLAEHETLLRELQRHIYAREK